CCGILFVPHESSYDKNIWLASRHGSIGDHHFRSRLDGRASCPTVAQSRRCWHVKKRPAEARVASRNRGLQADAGVAGFESPNAVHSTTRQETREPNSAAVFVALRISRGAAKGNQCVRSSGRPDVRQYWNH